MSINVISLTNFKMRLKILIENNLKLETSLYISFGTQYLHHLAKSKKKTNLSISHNYLSVGQTSVYLIGLKLNSYNLYKI